MYGNIYVRGSFVLKFNAIKQTAEEINDLKGVINYEA